MLRVRCPRRPNISVMFFGKDGEMNRRLVTMAILVLSTLVALAQAARASELKATDPNPPDGAEGVLLPLLQWQAGTTAKWHDVYFGTTPSLGPANKVARNIKLMAMYYHAPGLVPGQTYYWRIDVVEADGVTVHTGDVWSFTAAPYTAYSPSPADGGGWIALDVTLTWMPGASAQSHDVYFGTNKPDVEAGTGGTLKGNRFTTSYKPGGLVENTTYYWRVDERAAGGVIYKGQVWSFTTAALKLTGFQIACPHEVIEGTSAQCSATANYEGGSSRDVTRLAVWTLSPHGYANVDPNGLLTVADIDATTVIVVSAQYTEGEITLKADKSVTCIARPPEHRTYHIDALNGSNQNNGGSDETAFKTIQKGIDSAHDGDTVLVHPGVYREAINFLGKAITVQSAEDAAILEAPGEFAVSFYTDEGRGSVLRNLIIRNSYMGAFIAGSSPTISNLTVADNSSGIEAYVGSEPDISNCIFWNNPGGDVFGCKARYSRLDDGAAGTGNIDLEPMFADPNNGDYHLLSERGRYWLKHGVWVLDSVTSSCIDAGDPNADYSREPMPNGGRIDMGAHGGSNYASMKEPGWNAADTNRDGWVNMTDLAILADNWLRHGPTTPNLPPQISITTPADGVLIHYSHDTPIEIEADAWDADGMVVKVEFFVDGSKIGEDNDGSDGWKGLWQDPEFGSHRLTARATDDHGAVGTSPVVTVWIHYPIR